MNIAVVTEVSTKEKNKAVVAALEKTGHRVLNVGMTGEGTEEELSYLHTGLITALMLNSGAADLVVGGCGTGQGYINSALQYPGVFAGLVETPLDAWLFRQINGGYCFSLALNKGYGWAADVNIDFIVERFFSVESGAGSPPYRREAQKAYRDKLFGVSTLLHKTMPEILMCLPGDIIMPVVRRPGLMELLRDAPNGAKLAEILYERAASEQP